MGSSRHSETRVQETHYNQHGDVEVLQGSATKRPTWLWSWVTVYVFLAFLALLLICLWVGNSGGTEWGNPLEPNLMFNLHPLLMILGFVIIIGHTNLLYRFWPDGRIMCLRIAHGTLQLTGWILIVMGVYAVGYSKDYSAKPGVPAKHFVSTHSWVGLTLLIVMTLQLVCGFFGLLFPGCHGERRAAYRSTHIFTGNVIFLLGCAQILIGIDQLKSTATTNTLALIIAGYAILGGYLLSTNKFHKGRPQHPDAGATSEERQPLASQGDRPSYN